MGGGSDEQLRRQLSRYLHGQILLTQVNPIRLHCQSDIHMIVDDEQDPGSGSTFSELHCQVIQIPLGVVFLSELDYL